MALKTCLSIFRFFYVCRKLICAEVECREQRGKLQKSENCKNCKALGSLLKMRYICLPAAANNVVSPKKKKKEPRRRMGQKDKMCPEQTWRDIMFFKNSITHDEGANLFSFERRSVVIALMPQRWQFSINFALKYSQCDATRWITI